MHRRKYQRWWKSPCWRIVLGTYLQFGDENRGGDLCRWCGGHLKYPVVWLLSIWRKVAQRSSSIIVIVLALPLRRSSVDGILPHKGSTVRSIFFVKVSIVRLRVRCFCVCRCSVIWWWDYYYRYRSDFFSLHRGFGECMLLDVLCVLIDLWLWIYCSRTHDAECSRVAVCNVTGIY